MLYVQVEDFELSVRLECELRPYQREGIAWLAFLRRTGLHGCLADDMGLGKTLQATAIIAGQNLCRRDTPYAVDGSSAPAAALVVLLAGTLSARSVPVDSCMPWLHVCLGPCKCLSR